MKTNNKRILSIILALVMILSMLPMVALAATPSKLYLKPNSNWTKDGARFAAYFFGNGEKWLSMTDSDGDGYYEVDVPSGYPKVIFCRMNGSASANNWNNKWNQTGDLTIPTDGKNCFTVASGSWDGATTSWGTYTPVVVPEFNSPIVSGDSVTFNYWDSSATAVYVAGNMNGWSSTANPMSKNDQGIWTTTISGLTNNDYQYKFVVGDNWLIDPKNDQVYTEANGNQNSLFSITEGIVPEEPTRDVTIHYRNTNIWEAPIYLYAWNMETTAFLTKGWPGSNMALEEDHANWYTATVKVPVSLTEIGIQFDNDANKTDELTLSAIPTDATSEYWYDDLTSSEFATEAPESWADGTVTTDPELPVDPVVPEYPEIIYLLPNFNWNSDYAAFAAYFFNTDGESTWVSMTDGNGDGVYEAAVPEGMTSVIFCRMDPAAAEPSWDSKWNQSSDLPIPTNGTDLCLMTQGAWDSSSTDAPWANTWATYTEIPVPEFTSPVIDGNSVTFNYWHYGAASVSVHGSMDDWGAGYAMAKDENGLWSVTINDLADALYQYKFVVDGVWILDPANWETYDEYDDEGNIKNQNSKFILGTPVAEIYRVGEFFTFESAYAAADPDNGDSIVLLSDLTVNDLVVDKEMYLNLNGHDLTINAASATATILAQDSATNDPNATEWGKLIVNGAEFTNLGGYVMLPEDDGYAFHSYSVEITHISLQPGKDALGFKAAVTGNSAVMNAITSFGFEMSVEGQDAVICEKDGAPTGGVFTLRLKNILACDGGEMNINATAFVNFGDAAPGWSNMETTTMKDTIQTVDANWSNYSAEQQEAVTGLMVQHADLISRWNLVNIAIAE